MRVNVLFGGEAGLGPNILAKVVADVLVRSGYYVFYSRDYQSLIRGGHNFNVLTFSDKPLYSNDKVIDVLIQLDTKTLEKHEADLKKGGLVLDGKFGNMYYAGALMKIFGLDFSILEDEFKKLEKFFDKNLKDAQEGYDAQKDTIEISKSAITGGCLVNGSEGVSQGAIKSGLDFYYAYPMTPATGVLAELANMEGEHLTIELESEIAVANAAVGSAITGAKTMIGSSGGGFDLMTETISLTGVAGVPLVIYVASRIGAGTGVATYTGQSDLSDVLYSGHGEFVRTVVAPGDPKECEELTNQSFYFSQKYQVPSIVLSDKHLAESFYTVTESAKIIDSLKTVKLGRFNSYEKDDVGSATDEPEIVVKNIDERNNKAVDITEDAGKFEGYKVYGKKGSNNVIIGWGSTKGAIMDAIEGLDVKFIQVLYMEPFANIKKEIEGKNIILVENNSTAQLGRLIAEKTGIFIKDKILRYDGRPFLADELRMEVGKRV